MVYSMMTPALWTQQSFVHTLLSPRQSLIYTTSTMVEKAYHFFTVLASFHWIKTGNLPLPQSYF